MKVACINYLNSLLFVEAIKSMRSNLGVDLINIVPSETIQYFKRNECDIALVPVAGLAGLKGYKIFSDYCISCDGAVESVGLFTNTDMNQVHTVYLDDHSQTSNNLAKILLRDYWNIQCKFESVTVSNKPLAFGEAKVMIGDKVFSEGGRFTYFHDFGLLWKKMTGLPFVFAVWIAKKSIPDELLSQFNEGINTVFIGKSEFVKSLSESKLFQHDVSRYLNSSIRYDLDEEKMEALELFLQKMGEVVKQKAITIDTEIV